MNEPPKLLQLPSRSKRVGVRRNLQPPEVKIDRAEKAFELRLQGKSLDTIAKELGITRSTAHKDLRTIANMKYQGMIEKDTHLLLEQNAYYDKLLERWLPLALDEELDIGERRTNKKGDEYDVSLATWEAAGAATDRVIKIMEAKAKINGLQPSGDHNKKSPEEIGTSVAASVLAAFQAIANTNRPIQAEVITGELTDAN